MADFQATVERVRAVEPIEGADRIELAVIGEFRSVVGKGQYAPGDLAVYLPEQAILPDWLIEKIGLTGKLSGARKNRIKAVKLRGTLSQGVLLPLDALNGEPDEPPVGGIVNNDSTGGFEAVTESTDVAAFLGIQKYDPMAEADDATRRRFYGNCAYLPGYTVKYDLENWKKNPNLFSDGEEVVITEKLHGTMFCVANWPALEHEDFKNAVYSYSKGLGARGQVFKWSEENAGNVYHRALVKWAAEHDATPNCAPERAAIKLMAALRARNPSFYAALDPLFIFGEVYGQGVQDLGYGAEEPMFRAFDVYIGEPGKGWFLDAAVKFDILEKADIPHVPVLYRGPYSRDVLLSLTDGNTMLSNGGHIREGVVVTPAHEIYVHRFGRKILKSVSGDYLTRKGGTEFN